MLPWVSMQHTGTPSLRSDTSINDEGTAAFLGWMWTLLGLAMPVAELLSKTSAP